MKKRATIAGEEISRLEQLLQSQYSGKEEACILVKCVTSLSEERWSAMRSCEHLEGWCRLPIQEHTAENIRTALFSLYQSAHDMLHDIQGNQVLLNTINMEIQRVERGSGEFSILMIRPTVDSTTDSSQVLEYMQSVLHSCVRAYDTIIMLEQNTFAVILPGASASNARLFAKRFQAIATHQTKSLLTDEERIHVGIATYRAGMPVQPQSIIEHARTALEEAMQKGVEVNQISSHLLGDSDRASMVTVNEKHLLYNTKENK